MRRDAEARHTASLAGFALVLGLLVLSLVVVRKLQVRIMLETCIATGQPGCFAAVNKLRVSQLLSRL